MYYVSNISMNFDYPKRRFRNSCSLDNIDDQILCAVGVPHLSYHAAATCARACSMYATRIPIPSRVVADLRYIGQDLPALHIATAKCTIIFFTLIFVPKFSFY